MVRWTRWSRQANTKWMRYGLFGLMIGSVDCRADPVGGHWRREATEPYKPPMTDLDRAVDAYHRYGEWALLQEWVHAHPDDPDAERWREIVALRRYETERVGPSAVVGDEPELKANPNAAAVATIAQRYGDTVGGRLAMAVASEEGMRRLSTPIANPWVIGFLEGRDEWAYDGQGRPMIPESDIEHIRHIHAARVRNRLGNHLHEQRCVELVGYCMWWVRQYPTDGRTHQLRIELKQIWYERGHPPWKGKRHANCALRCARSCVENADPPDDACFAPCYAQC